jgi:hypothetical protein
MGVGLTIYAWWVMEQNRPAMEQAARSLAEALKRKEEREKAPPAPSRPPQNPPGPPARPPKGGGTGAGGVAALQAKCLSIWYSYHRLNCLACLLCESRSSCLKKSRCFTAEIGLRNKYLKMKCDWILPGSISVGSAKKEADHRAEVGNKLRALTTCFLCSGNKKIHLKIGVLLYGY